MWCLAAAEWLSSQFDKDKPMEERRAVLHFTDVLLEEVDTLDKFAMEAVQLWYKGGRITVWAAQPYYILGWKLTDPEPGEMGEEMEETEHCHNRKISCGRQDTNKHARRKVEHQLFVKGLKMGLNESRFIMAPKKDPKDPAYKPQDAEDALALLEEVKKHFPESLKKSIQLTENHLHDEVHLTKGQRHENGVLQNGPH
jgi:hypothetical protein